MDRILALDRDEIVASQAGASAAYCDRHTHAEAADLPYVVRRTLLIKQPAGVAG
jgi:hypothetical protein